MVGFRSIELWDTASHAVVAVLPTPERVDDVAFSPDGRTLAASPDLRTFAAAGASSAYQLWTVVEPDARVTLGGFDGTTRSLAFRPDGLLAMGSWRGAVRFWDDGRCVNAGGGAAAAGRPEPVEAGLDRDREESSVRDRPALLAFDDRGRLVMLESDALRFWDDPPRCDSGGTEVPLPHNEATSRGWPVLAASRDGRTIAVGRAGQVFLWRSDAPGVLTPVTPPPSPNADGRDRDRDRGRGGRVPILAMVVAPGGDRLYVVEPARAGRSVLHAWDLGGPTARARPVGWREPPSVDAHGLALSPDGRLLATGDGAGGVTLVDTDRGTVRARLAPAEGRAGGVAWALVFSPDGKELAVGDAEGNVDLWSIPATGTPVPLVRLPGHRGLVSSLAYDPGGHRLASSASDRTVDIWNLDRVRGELTRLGLGW
jgi:WD40 repeat protein